MTYQDEVAAFIARSTLRIADISAYVQSGPAGAERATNLALRLSDFLVTIGDDVLPQDLTLRCIHLLNDQMAYVPPVNQQAPTVTITSPLTGTVFQPGQQVLVVVTALDQLAVSSVEILDGAGNSQGVAQALGTGQYQLLVTLPQVVGNLAFTARAVNTRGLASTAQVFVMAVLPEYGTAVFLDAQGDDSAIFLDAQGDDSATFLNAVAP